MNMRASAGFAARIFLGERSQSIENAVRGEGVTEAAATSELSAKEGEVVRRRAILRLALFIVLIGMTVLGFLLLSTSDPTQAFVGLLFMMIGLAGMLWGVMGRWRFRPRRIGQFR